MAPPWGWDNEDEWSSTGEWDIPARHVRAPPQRRSGLLDPAHGQFHAQGIHRSRSTGSRPAPHILNIHNHVSPRLDQQQRTPIPSPRGRSSFLDDEWALGGEANFAVGGRSRSRGRGLNYHHHDHFGRTASTSPDYRAQLELATTNQRIHELEDRMRREKEEDLLRLEIENKYARERAERDEEERLFKKRMELKLLKDKHEREEEEDRLKREEERIREKYERKRLEDERKREEEARKQADLRKRAILDEKERQAKEAAERKAAAEEYQRQKERKEKEEAEEKQRIIADFEKKKADQMKKQMEERQRILFEHEKQQAEMKKKQKEEEEALLAKIKREKEEKEAKQKAAWEEYERKRKDEEEKAKADKKKKEQELEEEMRKKLSQFGFQENQIQAMIHAEKAKELPKGLSPANPITNQLVHHHHHPPHTPTYVKVHRDHLSIDTLKYYDLPWEYDRADGDYIIILREMDPHETDILFEHTRRLRSRTTTHLLIEERAGRKPEYAWVRRRSHSKSPLRRRSSPKRVTIGDMFFK